MRYRLRVYYWLVRDSFFGRGDGSLVARGGHWHASREIAKAVLAHKDVVLNLTVNGRRFDVKAARYQ
jgi:hypothetical protein